MAVILQCLVINHFGGPNRAVTAVCGCPREMYHALTTII